VANDTRRRLLEETIAVLAAGGEQAVRIRDIARRAGVAEPSIYHFFGDRNGLIEAAQEVRYGRDQTDLFDVFDAAVSVCPSQEAFVEVVRRTLVAVFDPARAPKRMTRVSALGASEQRSALRARLAEQQWEANRRLGATFTVAQGRGFVAADRDPHAIAAWIVGMVTGRVLIELGDPGFDPAGWDRIATTATLAALGIDDGNLNNT